MALTVHSKDAVSKGQIEIFVLHFIFALMALALFLAIIQWFGGSLTWRNYSKYYVTLLPITVFLPLVIAITTAFSYKKVLLTITPASGVNKDRLKDFFFKEAYKAIHESEGKITFERSRVIPRFLCLNFDKPYIEFTPTEIRVYMLKRLSLVLLPQIKFGKRFEINPDSHHE
ncbi:MAG: hypothetical protein AB7S48_15885 [Bacteroidales bacterium]